jgi:DNA-directed RNA polymerase sigma subunit (sigma70/sigma32)
MGVSRKQHDPSPRPPIGDSDAETMRDLLRQVATTRPLGDGEQQRLLERAGLGDRASLERLVAVNLGLVIGLATAREEQGLSMPDLVQEGSIGLVEAVRSFATSGESDFVDFAEQRITRQMDAAIAAEAAAVRDAELLVTAATDYERTELLMRRLLERTRYIARVVADARRQYDEEMLEFIDPSAIDFDDDERVEFGR